MGPKDSIHPDAIDAEVNPERSSEHYDNRRVRVFVSSTFRDMIEDRNCLMTHTWPELRRFCGERQVELVEVDLRWGIAEEQSQRQETLKICLDEIRACRPFFIGLLGERYGWVPEKEAFTTDLKEEQSWLGSHHGKSVTELEILHGVLNNPDMTGRAFFYFRDPAYARARGTDFQAEHAQAAQKQSQLKNNIRNACHAQNIPLHENYPDPRELAALVLAQLKAAIDELFPKENIPDSLTREARDHEAFAEMRRRTYIGRPDYFAALDRHANSDGGPLLLHGESGSGKTALIANWVNHLRERYPKDFIFEHYIGGTSDSSSHLKLISRLIAEIHRWSDDGSEMPRTNDDILNSFPLWLNKGRIKAERDGVRFIVILDALNQLEDKEHAQALGWLPDEPFTGSLRLIVSALPGDILEALKKRSWTQLQIEPLTVDERKRLIVEYLGRVGKTLDKPRIDRLASAPATANPLFLKILMDDLRVTGTHDELDTRLHEYLKAKDIHALLHGVLLRYQRDYEHDRKGLVGDTLGLIYSSRRGLTETELLQLLRPTNLPQLPMAIWSPLRAALEESIIDRGGILNFAHDFLRIAVGTVFVPDLKKLNNFRSKLADHFEALPPTARRCDELPWLLKETASFARLRACLLDIDSFLLMVARDQEEVRSYWIEQLREQQSMGEAYLESYEAWAQEQNRLEPDLAYTANQLGSFLFSAALYSGAEVLFRRALKSSESSLRKDHLNVAACLNNLAQLLLITNRLNEAEPLMRRALEIVAFNNFTMGSSGINQPNFAAVLNNMATLLFKTNRLAEAESLLRTSVEIDERKLRKDHPKVAVGLCNLAQLLNETNRLKEAEPLVRRAIEIFERSLGKDHPNVADGLNKLAVMLETSNRLDEAETLIRRAIEIDEHSFGKDHPAVASDLNNLATLYCKTRRHPEAESLFRRALEIKERRMGENHPAVATLLNNLAKLLQDTSRFNEAEPLMRRALEINERSLGKDHPDVAISLNTLAMLLLDTNKLEEAESLMRRALDISERSLGKDHPKFAICLSNLAKLLLATDRLAEAEPLLRRSLEIDELSFGREHPEVARGLTNLGKLLKDANRFMEAEPLMRRAIEIFERSLGKDHPDVASSLNNLAGLFQVTNRLVEAEPLYKRTLQIYEHSSGNNHPDVARTLNNWAQLLKDTQRFDEAEPLMRRALEIDEKNFGQNHPTVAIRLGNLARLLMITNRFVEAEPIMRRALAINEHSLGKKHPDFAVSLNNLAELLYKSNQLTEAELLYRRAIDANELRLGTEHLDVAINLNNLALLLQSSNRLVEAEPLMRRALIIFERSFGKDHLSIARVLSSLAALFRATNRIADAESLLRRAHDIFAHNLGEDHPDTVISLNNLAELLYTTGQFPEAEHLFRQALDINERRFGKEHPNVAIVLNNLGGVLKASNRLAEAEPVTRRMVEIFLKLSRETGQQHQHLSFAINNYGSLLEMMGRNKVEIMAILRKIAPEFF